MIFSNIELLAYFPSLVQKLLPRSLSDHFPISLTVEEINWGPRPFKIFNHWLDSNNFKEAVSVAWDSIRRNFPNPGNLWAKLKCLKKAIKELCNLEGNAGNCSTVLEKEIHELENSDQSSRIWSMIMEDIISKKTELWVAHREKERAWLQKSRLRWFNEGDKNSKYFHLVASSRRRANLISQLTVNSIVYDSPDLRLKECSVCKLDNEFTVAKVWDAIQSCGTSKAPRPDRFSIEFIRAHWNIMKEDVMAIFDESYKTESFDRRLNASFIVLVL
ncbi:hypothetical protein DITRI_Ditri05aG0055300 [Diplodiscus trichospermus]